VEPRVRAYSGDGIFVVETPAHDEEEGVVVTVEDREARTVDEADIDTTLYDPMRDLYDYRSPTVSLLENYTSSSRVGDAEIYENKSKIESTLKNFGIAIKSIHATAGPTVTLYEIVQAEGVKISKIQGLEDDIAQSLKALGIRIIAPIPGKGTIGIEVPNRDKQIVSMYSSICSPEFQNSRAELPIVIGRTIQNENYTFDLAKMPHLLVAGATGQGKSVGLNAIITSLLYKKHPSQLKLVMIDPKMVEFSPYAKLDRHFLAKMASEEEAIITDPKKAVYTLNSLEMEMDSRLELCKKAGARNIVEYNEKFVNRRLNPNNGHKYLPYIVVIIDEFADLIMTAKEVERPVMRLAQKARAIGIHLIIATQRPDVKVITGGIKANFPARIAFRVMQMIDSRTIIDQPGANQLIGRGDMLFSNNGELTRIQCALVETREVERIVDYVAGQQGYSEAYALPDYVPESGSGEPGGFGSDEYAPVKYDSLFAEIARVAVSSGQISTSSIQRNYEVGFNRAGRIMMQLERAGIVGRQEGAKPRAILFHDLPSLEAKLQELGVF
ncbi:MAG: DNA translocase FtsK, partial [Alistipes sp.]|nr:DNA translocase FtsK [Alistipes sp.]